ncbi:glycine zipper domain-containing protein [uncultured Gimesia sp.]|mgnify:CR=1 FL=1|uniref:glycine zipper domain-containing protein n=1 Tax=uncultured Gimesia sp. TaxID=1678688 RepID=UPI002607D53A|nr:glycine zipper domain-containing protein [uncultured Gimesia sp.]
MTCVSHQIVLTFLLSGLLQVGCSSMNHTQAGAANGAGIGAVTGAIIGSHTGDGGVGALIGAATGGLAGSLIGNAEDERVERDVAVAQAHHEQKARAAIRNSDVLEMSHNGVSDSVIMGSIRSRGGAFDLHPQTLIALKQQGLSDPLLEFMQSHNYVPASEAVVIKHRPARVVGGPAVVYVTPRPRPRRPVRTRMGLHGHFHF